MALKFQKVKELRFFFSEYGLIRYRVLVEVRWLLKLSEILEVIEVPNFSDEAKRFLENLVLNFSPDDASEMKKIEKVTNHDVKAVEYFLKKKCRPHVEVGKVLEFFHFSCTSKDINNLAHGLMLRDAVNLVMLPIMDELIYVMCDMAKTSNVSMLSRTHGQAASPTTLGKELTVFSFRMNNQKKLISQVKLLGKFAGAVGNYNAHLVAYPNIDWPRIAEEFVESLEISFNPYVTQEYVLSKEALTMLGGEEVPFSSTFTDKLHSVLV
ncbi:Adenylosuccinate lyase [Nymphaea thermarum]|nr:Adenylosuccinate lyase [Nymphaea thermarum]